MYGGSRDGMICGFFSPTLLQSAHIQSPYSVYQARDRSEPQGNLSLPSRPSRLSCARRQPGATKPFFSALVCTLHFFICGLDYQSYRYYKAETRALDLDGMLEDLKAAPQDACVVLHACAHNPTGVDPNEEQWQQIAEVCIAKNFFVIMDAAYLGFASGSPVKDSYAIRYFVSKNIPLVVCQSYSKIFGLYNERTGACLVVTPSEQTTKAVVSQMKVLVRRNWSNPPAHGARIVATVLSDAALKARWFEELKSMSGRIISMREKLYAALLAKKTPGTWNHIVDQIGMFTFTGLTEAHVAFLTEKYHIYMLKNGRINMAGLRDSTVEVLAGAIDDAVRNCSNVSKL
eukprot:m.571350 g.571350  ORF g.571350 m.571350 type:complete len:345 (+) comp22266_c0_seq14:1245-2279(+)